jgi:hypothetical protein
MVQFYHQPRDRGTPIRLKSVALPTELPGLYYRVVTKSLRNRNKLCYFAESNLFNLQSSLGCEPRWLERKDYCENGGTKQEARRVQFYFSAENSRHRAGFSAESNLLRSKTGTFREHSPRCCVQLGMDSDLVGPDQVTRSVSEGVKTFGNCCNSDTVSIQK